MCACGCSWLRIVGVVVVYSECTAALLVRRLPPPRECVPVSDVLLHELLAARGYDRTAKDDVVPIAEVADFGLQGGGFTRRSAGVNPPRGLVMPLALELLGLGMARSAPLLVVFITTTWADVSILRDVPGPLAPL